MKKAISILCAITLVIGTVFCCGVTALAEEPTILYSEEVFDGYSGIETTTSGKVGYNHAVPLPNGEVVKFGFAPSNAVYREVYDEEFSLGMGWNFKIAHISEVDGQKYLYQTDGKVYEIDDSLQIVDYPSTHTLTLRSDGKYLLEEPFGYFSLFDANGRLLSSVDSYSKVTTYVYDANGLKEIIYPDGSKFIVQYSQNGTTETVRCFYVSSSEATSLMTVTVNDGKLTRIQDTQAGQLLFGYTSDGLLSYFQRDESDRSLQYETSITGKRLSKKFIVLDDVVTEYNYGYNAEGLLVTDTTVGQGTITYIYQQDTNGNLTTIRQENFGAGTFWTSNTKNELGQTISFSSPYGLTETTYDANNRLITQQDYGQTSGTITMAYNNHGQVSTETFTSGEVVTHTYLSDGTKDKEISSVRGVIYERPGVSTMAVGDADTSGNWYISNVSGNSSDYKNSSRGTLIGKANGTAAVLSITTYRGRTMSQFNCYHFAIRAFGPIVNGQVTGNPGFIYGGTANPSSSLNVLMTCFTNDQIALGRNYAASNSNNTVLSGWWKVCMMVKNTGSGSSWDYHFIRKDFSSTPWIFKAGQEGDLIVYLDGTTPEDHAGRWYHKVNNTYDYTSNFYNSGNAYFRIAEG